MRLKSIFVFSALALLASGARADQLTLGIGRFLNNIDRTNANGIYLEATARKSDCIKTLDCTFAFTYGLQHSTDFGGRDGGIQFVTAGLDKPWKLPHDTTLRFGGGLLVSIHFPVPENGRGEHQGVWTSECKFCGVYIQLSFEWRRFQTSCEYIKSDPNSYPAFNGAKISENYVVVF
jgi:hypothetical protein